jgi:hypothetical protein
MPMELGCDAPFVHEASISYARFLIMGKPVSMVVSAWVFLECWWLIDHPKFPGPGTLQKPSTIQEIA